MSGKLEDWFGTRKWRVATEVSGEQSVQVPNQEGEEPLTAEVVVIFRKGRFEVGSPGSFSSPLGSRGRVGVLLQEVGPDGKDIEGSRSTWGESVVRRAKEEFGAII
jgi:hypothetical protein